MIRHAAQATPVPVSGVRFGRTWYVPGMYIEDAHLVHMPGNIILIDILNAFLHFLK